MIEVFKTNIQRESDTNPIIEKLLEYIPLGKIDFDLEDCDKILRIEAEYFDVEIIIKVVKSTNVKCEVLP